ncbi:DUF418 domain-containing protein, partial [Streptomyces sp. NPDC046805]|uniref:DUF418 domain-containing protein n=1 Tax=Streptomyces sp. NPDC046805 TaxID=3155134 RepID=UPI0033FF16F7
FFADVWYVPAVDSGTLSALPVLLGFIAAAALLAMVWGRRYRRGPLEHLLHVATQPARHVK